MLTPGEFVLNAKASRQFYSQLSAINSGQQPVYRETGGTIFSTMVGDVNISAPTGSEVTAKQKSVY